MNGQTLDQTFGTGFSPVKSITGFNGAALNVPASPVTDPSADVTEQQHTVDATFVNGTLTIAPSPAGEGIWIPYLGNGTGTPGSKGWGTFSRVVAGQSWVATGPFSGCFVAAFTAGGGKRFAHLITPASGYTAASVDGQISAIQTATGATGYEKWPMTGAGLGLAFFMNIGGSWRRRFVFVAPHGAVMQINAHSTPLT